MDLDLRYEPGVSDNYSAFNRFFVADFAALVPAILVVLSLCGLISTAIAFCMLLPHSTASSGTRQDVERGNGATCRERRPPRFDAPAIQSPAALKQHMGLDCFGDLKNHAYVRSPW